MIDKDLNKNIFSDIGKSKRIDVNQIINFHQIIKSEVLKNGSQHFSISDIWCKSGDLMIRTNNTEIGEICYFMAVLYDKTNAVYIDKLIETYIHNKKYRYAVDFLEKMYVIEDEQSDVLFWNRLVTILPSTKLVQILTKPKNNGLEEIVEKFNLDINEVMTWMVLGYTLKTLDIIPNHLVLANQALDNALALKYYT